MKNVRRRNAFVNINDLLRSESNDVIYSMDRTKPGQCHAERGNEMARTNAHSFRILMIEGAARGVTAKDQARRSLRKQQQHEIASSINIGA
jgi:hypothetical protein